MPRVVRCVQGAQPGVFAGRKFGWHAIRCRIGPQMHFMCESCKASLSIADEKVKGKRLVVRCKRCGARIQIADPALGMAAILLAREGGPAGAARAAPRAAPL